MTYALGNRQIFGRETELDVLLQAYDRVSQTGFGEIVLIGGAAGFGKTSVVNAFLNANEYIKYAVGKADEAFQRVPYSAILKALRQLRPASEIEELASVRDAVTSSTTNRVKDHLIDAIQASSSPTTPLVLFVDDLHWLDESSIQLMRALSERGFRDMLIVGTYRTDYTSEFREVGLQNFLGDTAVRVTDILLKTLAFDAVEGLISAQRYGETTGPLARLVQSVAGGNPFHIQLILNVLNRAETTPDLAQFVSDQKNWSLNSLLSGIVAELPSETRRVLQFAACVGFTSEQSVLCSAAEVSISALKQSLQPAETLGLVQIDGNWCQFSHDSVREHIRGALSKDDKTSRHAYIAKSMLELNAAGTDQHLAVAEQIVKARTSPILLAGLEPALAALIKAAQIAKAVGSLDGALRYAEKGMELVSFSKSSDRYHWGFAELRCAILVDQFGAAIDDQELDRLIAYAGSPADQARAARLRAAVLILRGQFEQAIEVALSGLRLLGISLTRKPTKAELDAAYEAVTAAVERLSLPTIREHARLSDDTIAVAVGLLATLQSSFFSDDGLKFLHTAKIVELSAEHGVCDATCYGLAWCGVCLASEYGDYENALAMAEAGVALSGTHAYSAYRTSALVALDQVSVWLKPLSYSLARAKEAFEQGRNSGDISMACYATNHIVSDLLSMGAPLSVVTNEANRGIAMARSVGFEEVIRILQVQLAFVQGLRDRSVESGMILALATSDTASEMSPLIFWGHLFEGISQFYRGQIELAMKSFAQARKWKWTTPAHIHVADLHFYSALANQMTGVGNPSNDDRDILRVLAERNPATFENKLAFVDAEAALSAGDTIEALRQYERSIKAAKEAGFWHELALVHERAGRLSLETGLSFAAFGHIRQAQAHYQKWGADQLANGLRAEFAEVFSVPVDIELPDRVIQPIERSDSLTTDLIVAAVKYSGAMRGQLISVDGDDFSIIASTRLRDGVTNVLTEKTRVTAEMAPATIVRLVVESALSLRYGDAQTEAGDAHALALKECPVRSLLCVPLKDKDRVFAILYLENNALSDAFSLEIEQAIELFVVATTEALRLKGQLEQHQRGSAAQKSQDMARGSARAELIKNSHVSVLGGMAASIVHEVNQPLSAIVTFANSGIRWLKQPVPQVQNAITNFTKIEQSGVRASNIISALRSLAKQAPANLEFLDLHNVVKDVLTVVETDSRADGVEIECVLAEGSSVFADPIQVQQVVLNLMTNALDAMEPQSGGRRLRVESEVRDTFVILAVSDTGTGIPASARDSIFDPFFTTKDKGLGMGLAICKTIAEVHGGGLSIGSTNSSGTTMIFRLPLTTSPANKGAEAAA
ncbi:AAA family ATPase [Agrobacterium sp. RS6]|nr:AAA family ATPase [Agrobacterium sp. RS6]